MYKNQILHVYWSQESDPFPRENVQNHFKNLSDVLTQVYFQLPKDIRGKVKLPIQIVYSSKENLREVHLSQKFLIHINSQFIFQSSELQLWVHEFFHWIINSVKDGEEDWVQEGLAQVFEWKVLERLNGLHVLAFLQDPNFPFFKKYDLNSFSQAQYGQHMMYFYYLYENCGQDQLFWNLVRIPQKGTLLVDRALSSISRSSEVCGNFKSSLTGFALAKVHNQVVYRKDKIDRSYVIPGISDSPQVLKLSRFKELQQWVEGQSVGSSVLIAADLVDEVKSAFPSIEVYFLEDEFPFRVSKEKGEFSHYRVAIVKIERRL